MVLNKPFGKLSSSSCENTILQEVKKAKPGADSCHNLILFSIHNQHLPNIICITCSILQLVNRWNIIRYDNYSRTVIWEVEELMKAYLSISSHLVMFSREWSNLIMGMKIAFSRNVL